MIETKIKPPTLSDHDALGASMASSEDRIAVLANGQSQTVFVYKYEDNTAHLEQAIQIPSYIQNATTNGFCAMDDEGQTLAVGIKATSTFDPYNERVLVFKRQGTIWTQSGVLTPFETTDLENASFGGLQTIAVDGNWIFVSDYLNSKNFYQEGCVYVYRFNGSVWQQHQKIVQNSELRSENAWFGRCIDSEQGSLVVSSISGIDTGVSGGITLYTLNQGNQQWEESQIFSIGNSIGDYGKKVCLSQNWISIYGSGNTQDEQGSMCLIQRNNGTRKFIHAPDNQTGGMNDSFGTNHKFHNDSDLLIVSDVSFDTSLGDNVGKTYVYQFTNNSWNLVTGIMASDGLPDERFGYGVGFCGDHAVVCAVWSDEAGEKSGLIYSYNCDGLLITHVEKNEKTEKLQLFPNPAKTVITVINLPTEKTQISIFDMSGRNVLSKQNILSSAIKIDINDFPSGMYIISVTGENFHWMEKILKE